MLSRCVTWALLPKCLTPKFFFKTGNRWIWCEIRTLWQMDKTLPTKSCNMVLRYRRRVCSSIVIHKQNTRYEKGRTLFPNRLIQFHRMWQYHVALVVPTSKNFSNKTPWSSQKTMRNTLAAEGVVFNYFRAGNDGCFHSIDATFDSSVKWWTHVSSPSQSEKEIHCHHRDVHSWQHCSMWFHGQLSRNPPIGHVTVSNNVVDDLVKSRMFDSKYFDT